MSSEAKLAKEAKAMTRTQILTMAVEGRIRWVEAANILNLSGRQVRRLKRRFEECGVDFNVDGRVGWVRKRRIEAATLSELLRLRRERYLDFSVKHFHEHVTEKHGLKVSYGTALAALQSAGLAEKGQTRGRYRRKRERRPMVGMMLHIDASTHQWIAGQPAMDLVAVVDDADSRLLYAQLVEQEGVKSTLQALEAVLQKHGRFSELYHDRGSHYGNKSRGGTVESDNAVQRVCATLGIKQIYSLSPEARGRSERYFGTLQGRLPQELQLHGIKTTEKANAYLRETFIDDANRRFTVTPRQSQSAFVRLVGLDRELLMSVRHDRVVDNSNGVHFLGTYLQLPERRSGGSYAKMAAVVHQLLDGDLVVTVDGNKAAVFSAQGEFKTSGRRGKKNVA